MISNNCRTSGLFCSSGIGGIKKWGFILNRHTMVASYCPAILEYYHNLLRSYSSTSQDCKSFFELSWKIFVLFLCDFSKNIGRFFNIRSNTSYKDMFDFLIKPILFSDTKRKSSVADNMLENEVRVDSAIL